MAEGVAGEASQEFWIHGTPAVNTLSFTWHIRVPSAWDWIGLFIHDREFNNKYSAYQYTGGVSDGSGSFANLAEGFYDLRLFLNGNKVSPVCRSEPILVGEDVVLHAELIGRAVVVSWNPVYSSKTPTKDWIGIFLLGTKSNKRYVAFKYCDESGSVTFPPAPRLPGEYECRYFKADSGYVYSGKSKCFTVPNKDELSVHQLASGGDVRVNWTLSTLAPSRSDWIGIFAAGAPNSRYILSKYVTVGTITPERDAGTLVFTAQELSKLHDGEYDVRFFATSEGTYVSRMEARLLLACK